MFLHEVEDATPAGPYAPQIAKIRSAGHPIPQIMHLFAYKRGPSPLSPGLRELIAAFTSKRNDCPF